MNLPFKSVIRFEVQHWNAKGLPKHKFIFHLGLFGNRFNIWIDYAVK